MLYEYRHGGAVHYLNPDILDFSANINPLGMPKKAEEALLNISACCKEYPDTLCTKLREEINHYENVLEKYIICGNGASDLIFRLAFWKKPQKALLLAPSFLDYERALTAVSCEIEYFILSEALEFDCQKEILETLKQGNFDILYLCNPNNPTGCLLTEKFLYQILQVCKGVNCFIVLDECFMDFVTDNERFSATKWIEEFPNLFILKAFTKIFAMPGLRLGYGMCSNMQLLRSLYEIAPDWSVSAPAQMAGIAALQGCQGYLEKTRKYVGREKVRIKQILEEYGYKVYGSKANYLFFKGEKELFLEFWEKHNILLRSCDNFTGLNGSFYRMGIKNVEDNQRLIEAIKVLKGDALWQELL